ncbi:MAG: MerC domain-containing protein [Gammaproteobacteria bacterium]|nr:MerC domain-containing protein [Gammaproteobacteria bacterium]
MRYADAMAVGLSLSCLAHCLLLPLAVTLAPWVFPAFVSDERVHIFLLALAVPISAWGIGLGFRRHGEGRLVWMAVLGLALMIAGVLQETDWLERGLTVVGVVLVAAAHILNWRRRRLG